MQQCFPIASWHGTVQPHCIVERTDLRRLHQFPRPNDKVEVLVTQSCRRLWRNQIFASQRQDFGWPQVRFVRYQYG